MSNSDIEQTGTVKGHLPNGANLSGRISNGLSLSGRISIGSVASDFIIKMTLAGGDDGHYTLASCDTTVEQIDAAVSAGKRAVVIASDGSIAFELPMLQGAQGIMYAFGTFMSGQMMTSFVQKIDESTSEWQFLITQIQSESVDYSNDALPNVTNVKSALDDTIDTLQTQSADTESLRAGVSALMNAYQTQGGDIASLKTQAHTHSNKDTLDKLSVLNGKLQYNGSDVGAKEQLTGTTSELTPTQVYDAVSAGIPVKVQYLHDVYGLLSFTAFNIAESFNIVVSQTIVYYNGAYILAELNGHKSENRWGTLFTTLAEKTDIPTRLPNPHAITFTGAVTGNYDGSTPMTVNIPSAVTDEHINSLIDTKLGVIENGSY